MDDTDEQDEDSSMEKMTDSFSKVVTVHGSTTKDSDTIESVWLKSGCKSSEDVKMETSTPSSDTHYSASMDIRYV